MDNNYLIADELYVIVWVRKFYDSANVLALFCNSLSTVAKSNGTKLKGNNLRKSKIGNLRRRNVMLKIN